MAASDELIIAPGALSGIGEVCARLWPKHPLLVVADSNTWKAAGRVVYSHLKDHRGSVESLVFEDRRRVHPDYAHVETVKRRLHATPSMIAIAVGSGSLNDIVKLASYEMDRSYGCVPTAPSVDGYTSSNAPITINGFKQTIPCRPPRVVIADVDVLRGSPQWLISSGYGDLVAKITSGADWIIADTLHIEKIDPMVWEYVQGPLKDRIAHPEAIVERNSEVIDHLFKGLAETGNAMRRFGNSRPASGSEHLLSHVWEMDNLSFEGEEVSHGFKVALGTLVSTAMMELLLQTEPEALAARFDHEGSADAMSVEQYLVDHFDEDVGIEAKAIAVEKELDEQTRFRRKTLLVDNWHSLVERLEHHIIPFKQLRSMLERAHCPIEPADIGVDRGMMAQAMRKARIIRPRYTIFDLAYECDMLEYMIGEIVYSDRYFNRFYER